MTGGSIAPNPCAFCGGPDAAHRQVDAEMSRILAGEALDAVAHDYGHDGIRAMIEGWRVAYERAIAGWSECVPMVAGLAPDWPFVGAGTYIIRNVCLACSARQRTAKIDGRRQYGSVAHAFAVHRQTCPWYHARVALGLPIELHVLRGDVPDDVDPDDIEDDDFDDTGLYTSST